MAHVIAHHRVGDLAGFLEWTGEPVAGRPLHWRLILSAPARGGQTCFCLWWADSADALERFLRRTLGDVSDVECYEVDEEQALGLAPAWAAESRGRSTPLGPADAAGLAQPRPAERVR
jgi:hypothetical protein